MTMKINHIRSGDYFISELSQRIPPIQFNTLALSGKLWSYLADLNEQAQQRMEILITQYLYHP